MLPIGVIEGFYGKVWSWTERVVMLDFLSAQHFSSYWYAPKADAHLRKHWTDNWARLELDELVALSCHAARKQVNFGIGLSPLGLYKEWRQGAGRDQLLKRLEQIAEIQPKGLALLFDDMQGDLPDLAKIQTEIAHFVADNIQVEQLILCPSYYSFDPVLEQLFGAMPKNYWKDLGSLLDTSIDIFWTGDKVISTDYASAGLALITELFRRKPVIWDNSIVNDGRKTSPFLNLHAMFDPETLVDNVTALLVNPMNAPAISRISLSSLQFKGTEEERFLQALKQQAPDIQQAVLDCLDLFSVKGRDNLTAVDYEKLNMFFRASSSPIAQDIISWLDGAYQFDPACLT